MCNKETLTLLNKEWVSLINKEDYTIKDQEILFNKARCILIEIYKIKHQIMLDNSNLKV